MELTQLDHLPDGLLEKPASALYQQLTGPTLIHLRGRRKHPLFVSVLQHGNEDTGWEAVRRLLKTQYSHSQLPRSLSLLIGNVEAARHRVRHLDHQPDFNRCWPAYQVRENRAADRHREDSEYHQMFRQVTDLMRERRAFASIDIHNNTGMNPHYAAVNRMDNRFFRLASLFSHTVIYFEIPRGVQSNAFADFCPAVTLECGQAGDVHGTDHSLAYLQTVLQQSRLSGDPLVRGELDLFHMVATVRVPDTLSFGFGSTDCQINFIPDLDHLNFCELEAGTLFGHCNGAGSGALHAVDLNDHPVTSDYFRFDQGRIRTRRRLMPSMLTIDKQVIRQDCLCYLMERLDTDALRRTAAEPLPEPTGQRV